jgi:hypothetical protein
VLYEEKPWSDINDDESIKNNVLDKKIKPSDKYKYVSHTNPIKTALYDVMDKCFIYESYLRPNFTEILKYLYLINEKNIYLSFDFDRKNFEIDVELKNTEENDDNEESENSNENNEKTKLYKIHNSYNGINS